ncbi:MAG: N-acetyl-D-Glu racemase DgcA, partial [Pseudomonadota bacterium]
ADRFRLAEKFTISRGSQTEAEVLTVTVSDGTHKGHGECVPYARYGESMDSVAEAIRALPQDVTRDRLQEIMAPGAARNAVDCALWDLEAKRAGKRAWDLINHPVPRPEITAYTLSLDTPENMRAAAERHAHRPLLKIKLGTPEDMPRVEAVRAGAPKAKIIVDANEGWRVEDYVALAPHLVRLGVAMVEQPLPAGKDDALADIERPLPVCADESCHDRASLPGVKGKYDMVNIKLDKTGGLTEALALKQAAMAEGYQIMVGCMIGTSLGMAPAVLIAQGAAVVDLDGPLLLAEDRALPLAYDEKGVWPPEPGLWG